LFNPRTHGWQYDLPTVSISPPNGNFHLDPIVYQTTPLRADGQPQLDSDMIAAFFENEFGDFLSPIASSGETKHFKNVSDFTRHGLLTFGAVVDRNRPGILAYLPTASPPESWCCENQGADVKASYSSSVPSRVDLFFRHPDCNEMEIHFFLGLPNPFQHRAAYLSQSLLCSDNCSEPYDDLGECSSEIFLLSLMDAFSVH